MSVFCESIYLTEDRVVLELNKICEKIEGYLHPGLFSDERFNYNTLNGFLISKKIFELRLSDLNRCEQEILAWKEKPD